MKTFRVQTHRGGYKTVQAMHACAAVAKVYGRSANCHREECTAECRDASGKPPIAAICKDSGVTHHVIYVEHG